MTDEQKLEQIEELKSKLNGDFMNDVAIMGDIHKIKMEIENVEIRNAADEGDCEYCSG